MARINLLPWREELRTKRQNEFIGMIGGTAAFMVLVMFGVHTQIETEKDFQNKRNEYLKREIKTVDLKITEIKTIEKAKADLISRMDVIQSLQSSRPQIVHVFDEMAKAIPEGIYVYDLNQKGDIFTLKGMAQSNARVSTLLRNLEASDWLGNQTLESITKGRGDSKLSDFTVTVKSIDKNKANKDTEK